MASPEHRLRRGLARRKALKSAKARLAAPALGQRLLIARSVPSSTLGKAGDSTDRSFKAETSEALPQFHLKGVAVNPGRPHGTSHKR
jgi:hypothetical protein